MLYFFDRLENLVGVCDSECVTSDTLTQGINSNYVYTFTLDYAEEKLKMGDKIGLYIDNIFQLFVIADINITYEETAKTVVNVIHDFYTLSNIVIEDKRVINGTCKQALTKCLEGTNYTAGVVFDNQDGVLKNINFYYISSLQGLNKIISIYGGELQFRFELNDNKTRIVNRYIDIKYKLGSETGYRISFDNCLNSVEKYINDDFYTVLYGRGKALESGDGFGRKLDFASVSSNNPYKPMGQKYIEDTQAITKYGVKMGIYEDENIEDPQILLNDTWDQLQKNNKPKISVKASIKDISKINGFEFLKLYLGDTIIIVSEEYDLCEEGRVVEVSRSILTEGETVVTLGNIIKGFIDDVGDANIVDRLDKLESKPSNDNVDDNSFPNTLPAIPILAGAGGFSTVGLSWTYERKSYYYYELYASKINNFNPSSNDLIFKGQASSFLHTVKPAETWYYRVRCINSHNAFTDYSNQIQAHTAKIADGTEYFENLAITSALIASINADTINAGAVRGQYIDAKNLSVTDGNNVKTLDIDSFGNVNLNVKELSIKNKNVETGLTDVENKYTELKQSTDDFKFEVNKGSSTQIIGNSRPTTSLKYWCDMYSEGNSITSFRATTGSGENFEGETFNSGMWFNMSYSGTGWCGVRNESFKNYKFNLYSYYRLKLYIYSKQPTTLLIKLSRRDGQGIVFEKVINITGEGYYSFNEVFKPAVIGDAVELLILAQTPIDDVFYIPYVMLYEGSLKTTWSARNDEVFNTYVTINSDGLDVANGAISITNNNNDKVLQSDVNGNLKFNGEMIIQNVDTGYMKQKLRGVVHEFYEGAGNGVLCGELYGALLNNSNKKGLVASIPAHANFLGLGINRQIYLMLNNGNDASINEEIISYSTINFTKKPLNGVKNINRTTAKQDVWIQGIYISENEINTCLGGTPRLWLNYWRGNGVNGNGTPYPTELYVGDGGGNGRLGHIQAGSLGITGSKNAIQKTEHHGDLKINAYETADYYFGDIGCGAVENNECIIMIDEKFRECINSNINYHVFLTKYGAGDIYVSERNSNYFIVKGDNIKFSWELKAKRKGFENNRLEVQNIQDTIKEYDHYEKDANTEIAEDIEKLNTAIDVSINDVKKEFLQIEYLNKNYLEKEFNRYMEV